MGREGWMGRWGGMGHATLCVATVLFPSTASAHHYASSSFDASKSITLTGTVKRVEWTNPHAHLFIAVASGRGPSVSWVCETSSPGELTRRGLHRADLKPGDTVTVEGFRSKSAMPALIVRSITLSDGRVITSVLGAQR